MTFLQHIAKTGGLRVASSSTLRGQGGLAVRKERRFSVGNSLHPVTPAATLPGDSTPRSNLAGDPRRGSGP